MARKRAAEALAREKALTEAVAADRPIRWLIQSMYFVDPNTLDAATRVWLRGCLRTATAPSPTDGTAGPVPPLTHDELHDILVAYGRRSVTTPTRPSDIPAAVQRFLKPGWPTDVRRSL